MGLVQGPVFTSSDSHTFQLRASPDNAKKWMVRCTPGHRGMARQEHKKANIHQVTRSSRELQSSCTQARSAAATAQSSLKPRRDEPRRHSRCREISDRVQFTNRHSQTLLK